MNYWATYNWRKINKAHEIIKTIYNIYTYMYIERKKEEGWFQNI